MAASARDASSSLRLSAVKSTSTKPSASILPSLKSKSHAASVDANERSSSRPEQVPKNLKDPNKKKHDSSVLPSSNIKQTKAVDNKNDEFMKKSTKQEVGVHPEFYAFFHLSIC